jgi:hypothetical protein
MSRGSGHGAQGRGQARGRWPARTRRHAASAHARAGARALARMCAQARRVGPRASSHVALCRAARGAPRSRAAQKKGRSISAPATRQSSVLQLALEVVGRKTPKNSYSIHPFLGVSTKKPGQVKKASFLREKNGDRLCSFRRGSRGAERHTGPSPPRRVPPIA